MRARNLKPGFFKNEILGSADPLYGQLFQGLWLMADREGRLEDRPLRMSGELFPYRRSVTEKKVDRMLDWLQTHGFILRYSLPIVTGEKTTGCDQKRYIQIFEFSKHQNPHINEAPSVIPCPRVENQSLNGVSHGVETVVAPERNSAKTVSERNEHPTTRASSLIPSSLIPDSLSLDSRVRSNGGSARAVTEGEPTPGKAGKAPDQARPASGVRNGRQVPDSNSMDDIARIRAAYPVRAGRTDWDRAEHFCHVLIERHSQTWDSLEAAVKRYATYADATQATRTQHVMMPGNFFGASDKPWSQPWELPTTETESPVITWRPPPDDDEEPPRANG